jgi:hypothetical protein
MGGVGLATGPHAAVDQTAEVRKAQTLLRSSWGYRETKRRYGKRFPTTIMGRADAALSKALKPTPTPAPVPPPAAPALTMWHRHGVLVDQIRNFAPGRNAILTQTGVRWVAVKVHHGKSPQNTEGLPEWIAAARGAGLRVCGWGWLDQDPDGEAVYVNARLRELGLDCYIADAEDPYMHGYPSGDIARSARFVSRFTCPGECAVSTLGAAAPPWVLPFDYAPWIKAGWGFLPQAYPSIVWYYDVQHSVDHALRAGWPRTRVHPMIGVGWSQGAPKLSGADFVPRLRAAGTVGWSVFLGETSSDDDFRALKEAP